MNFWFFENIDFPILKVFSIEVTLTKFCIIISVLESVLKNVLKMLKQLRHNWIQLFC